MKKRIRIQGFLIFLAVLITVLLSKLFFPQWRQEPNDELVDGVGIALVLFGFLFRISARGYKKEMSANSFALVKDGPYAMVRNPMYFGTFLIGTGIIAVLFKAWLFLLFAGIFLAIYIPQIKKEEAVLLKSFGQEYKEYCKITPKYFPGFYHWLNIRDYIILKYSWIKQELSSMAAVILVIIAIEVWEDVRLFGRQEFLKESVELVFIILSFALLVVLFSRKAILKNN
jgi:protein-S-isoprenylcysteine O-methyltransferase Ste14